MKICPHCAEEVQEQAVKCRYCGSRLVTPSSVEKRDDERITYIVDRDIVRFGKFAGGVLAVFIAVGIFFFGLNLKETVKELEKARESVEASRSDLETARETLENARLDADQATQRLSILEQRARGLIAAIEGQRRRADELVFAFEARLTGPEARALEELRGREPSLFRDKNGENPFLSKLWANGTTLRVRFLSGDLALQRRVLETAGEWTQFANLDFQVVEQGDAEIRILLQAPGNGTWSYVGVDALVASSNQPTMSLGILGASVDREAFRFAVLHEFGHVLGLIHEQQNPNSDIPWDTEAVYKEYGNPPFSWTREQIDRNFLRKHDYIPADSYRDFDPKSIMWYPIPHRLLTAEIDQREGAELSEGDKEFVRRLYPPG